VEVSELQTNVFADTLHFLERPYFLFEQDVLRKRVVWYILKTEYFGILLSVLNILVQVYAFSKKTHRNKNPIHYIHSVCPA